MPGPYKISDWNDLIRRVNDILENPPEDENCPAVDPIDEVTAPHIWRKSDIREVQNKLKETCPDIEFEAIDGMWKQSTIDEIEDAMLQAWCNCTVDCPNARSGTAYGNVEVQTLQHVASELISEYVRVGTWSCSMDGNGMAPSYTEAASGQTYAEALASYGGGSGSTPEQQWEMTAYMQEARWVLFEALIAKVTSFEYREEKEYYQNEVLPQLNILLAAATTPEDRAATQAQITTATEAMNLASENESNYFSTATTKAQEVETLAGLALGIEAAIYSSYSAPNKVPIYSICQSVVDNYWDDIYSYENFQQRKLGTSNSMMWCVPSIKIEFAPDTEPVVASRVRFAGSYNSLFLPVTGRACVLTHATGNNYGTQRYTSGGYSGCTLFCYMGVCLPTYPTYLAPSDTTDYYGSRSGHNLIFFKVYPQLTEG